MVLYRPPVGSGEKVETFRSERDGCILLIMACRKYRQKVIKRTKGYFFPVCSEISELSNDESFSITPSKTAFKPEDLLTRQKIVYKF